jgi:hypothetical protein
MVDSTFKVRRLEMQGNDRVAHEVPLSSDTYQNYTGPMRITAFISTISIGRAGDRPYGKVIITAKDMVLLGREDNISGIAVKIIVGKDSPLPAKESPSMESILTIIRGLDKKLLKSLALVLPGVLTTFTPEGKAMIRVTISAPSTATKPLRAVPNVSFKPTAQNPHMQQYQVPAMKQYFLETTTQSTSKSTPTEYNYAQTNVPQQQALSLKQTNPQRTHTHTIFHPLMQEPVQGNETSSLFDAPHLHSSPVTKDGGIDINADLYQD